MKKALAAALASPLLPAAASACAVCFGKADGQKGLIDGIWWGIILLLTATMAMVSGVFYLLWKVEKSREAAAETGA
jgi:hypothetical protein